MNQKTIKEILDFQIPEEYISEYTEKDKEELNIKIINIVFKNIESRLFQNLSEENQEKYNNLENKEPQEYIQFLIENSEDPTYALEQIGEEVFEMKENLIDLIK
ncbi:hypothetical protein CSB11_03065 [Candidatus Campbellbacteria bacterium]|nr:MAG: hypothetical protein CSB11_03065 [Candidatus Campbellbacteria bacterium]